MDDFGSGYSSLNLLRKVPIDTLKIDKVFIDSTEDVQRSQVIVEEIINMASKIHVKTICEGVETQSQRDLLKKCRHVYRFRVISTLNRCRMRIFQIYLIRQNEH